MHQCRCLCGSVTFEIEANLNHAVNCHCKYCRRSHGSQYVTVLVVLPNNFNILSGEDCLKRYPEDENKTGRIVCSKCGSKLYAETKKGLPISVHTSVLEDESQVKIMAHTNIESKSPALTIVDDLPKFSGSITKDDYMKLVR